MVNVELYVKIAVSEFPKKCDGKGPQCGKYPELPEPSSENEDGECNSGYLVLKHALESRLLGKGAAAENVIEIARKSAAEVRSRVPVEFLEDVVDSYSVAIRIGFCVCLGSAVVSFLGGVGVGRHELSSIRPGGEEVEDVDGGGDNI